jgi:hypothetical protein
MCCKNFISKLVICKRKNSQINWFLCHSNIILKFCDISHIRKKESILIFSIWPI